MATVWARLANLPPSLDWIALAVVAAIWGAAFFVLGVLVVTLAFDEVSEDAILASPARRAPSYPPPVSHYAPLAPTVAATPRAAPPGRVLLVLPAPRAPAK